MEWIVYAEGYIPLGFVRAPSAADAVRIAAVELNGNAVGAAWANQFDPEDSMYKAAVAMQSYQDSFDKGEEDE